ncbi:MAG: hypothetical protein WCH98_14250 [Verrucomicrobiota bacterium]
MSLHLASVGKFIPFSVMSSWVLLSSGAAAQSMDDSRSRSKPGVVLVKPQAWSNDEQASVVEFSAFTDHSGYIEFRTAKAPNFQVATAKIVKLVVYPDSPPSLTTAEQRATLQKSIDEFAALSEKYPAAVRQLEKAAAPLKSDVAKYDAGNVKDDGQWTLRSAYYKQKATALADLLRPELVSAPRIKEVDLTANQYFLGLQDLAQAEPSVRTVVESVRALYDSLVRKSDREELLNQINSPVITFDQAVELVNKLKALQPREDARANLFVQSWDTAVANAGQLTKQITDTQAQFESSMPAPEDSAKPPVISPDLAVSLEKLAAAAKAFRSGSPPTAIRVPLQLADAMLACGEKFPALGKQIQAREFLDAKALIDPLTNQAGIIGPKTSKALAGIQKKLNGDIEKFQSLRNEGKMLAENDKIEAALKKYQQAYAIIPAKDVAAQIDALKKQ